jgi:hypothetical protein
MPARSAIAVGLLALLATGATATGAKPGGGCSVRPLPRAALHRAAADVSEYRRIEARQRRPDLMGFRRGPRLGPPSKAERARIEEAREQRRDNGLNPSTLLIRRLARDHSTRSLRSRSFWVTGLKVTTVEELGLRFRDRVEAELPKIEPYVRQCARTTYAGEYFDSGRPWPARYRIVVLFKGPLERHRKLFRTRVRYHSLMPIRHARFSLHDFAAVQERLDADWEDWKRQGFELNTQGFDVRRNAIVVGIANPSPDATEAFRERYGSAVILEGFSIPRRMIGPRNP